MIRNPNWTRDELILALDFYFKVGVAGTSKNDPELISLSMFLNDLPLHREESTGENFRNPNGVYMKLCNFLRLDPDYSGEGLRSGSKLDIDVWNEFAGNRDLLDKTAASIRRNYRIAASSAEVGSSDFNSEDGIFLEGQILTRLHHRYERNPLAAKKKKQRTLEKTGKLIGEVCDFDFYQVYGDLGKDFAECHHIIPLSELKNEAAVRLSDLAIVCANCHRILHRSRSRPMLRIQELREVVMTQRQSNQI